MMFVGCINIPISEYSTVFMLNVAVDGFDRSTFLGNPSSIPPLTQHFALSDHE